MRWRRIEILIGILVAWGCGDGPRADDDAGPGPDSGGPGRDGGLDSGGGDDGGRDAGPAMDTGMPVDIPDPGAGMDDWGFSVAPGMPCCSTPMTAYRVGTATMNPGYVQGDIDAAAGEFFYVFRAGPALTDFVWPGGPATEEVHLHEGTGLVFGPHVTPTMITPTTGTWPVTAGQIYVLHLVSSTGGFF